MTSLSLNLDALTDKPQAVGNMRLTLGEGPIWVESLNGFFFTDIVEKKIYALSLDTQIVASYDPPQNVAFILPSADNNLILGYPRALGRFSLGTRTFSPWREIEEELPINRLNDGCVAPDGTIWFGSLNLAENEGTGFLYHGVADKNAQGGIALSREADGFIVSNGPTVSPDGKLLYVCDSARQIIYVYDIEADGLKNRRVFAKLTQGYPDGIVADSAGNVWCCVWAGSRIECFSPQGEIVATYPMPATNVTKLAFGGADMRTVLVTTAARDLSEADLAARPSEGDIFMFRAPVAGQKFTAYGPA